MFCFKANDLGIMVSNKLVALLISSSQGSNVTLSLSLSLY